MATRPDDTSATSWRIQRKVLASMEPAVCMRTAIDLRESVRELQIQGILARNSGWSRSDAVDLLVRRMTGRGVNQP